MKKKGIIRTIGTMPTLPFPGRVQILFADEHSDDPGGAIGRLDGHDKHADIPVDE